MVAARGRNRWSWAAVLTVTTVVTACGGAGQTHGHQHRHTAKAGRQASSDETALTHAGATATVPAGVSSASLPHGWTACPATASKDAGGASPVTPGCGFVRATEVQVQELLHNEGSTVFNTPESIGVSYGNDPERLLNCTAQNNGPTIVCADNGVPWVLVFQGP